MVIIKLSGKAGGGPSPVKEEILKYFPQSGADPRLSHLRQALESCMLNSCLLHWTSGCHIPAVLEWAGRVPTAGWTHCRVPDSAHCISVHRICTLRLGGTRWYPEQLIIIITMTWLVPGCCAAHNLAFIGTQCIIQRRTRRKVSSCEV